jgi:flavin reductase (DIM6/NTAB) family NADH-FMN oxidoreductase RutF
VSEEIHFTAEEAPGGARHVLNAIVAPRAIAWVGSVGEDGTQNLAPHSYTTVFSTDPPIVGFVSTGEKDTLRNVRQSGEFTYNVVGDELLDVMNLTSADFPAEISEFAWTGLTPVPGEKVSAPRVAEAPASMECRVVQIAQVPGARSWLVLGEVVAFHVSGRVWKNERIDLDAVRPLARLGGSDYARFGEITTLKRPVYKNLIADAAESDQI